MKKCLLLLAVIVCLLIPDSLILRELIRNVGWTVERSSVINRCVQGTKACDCGPFRLRSDKVDWLPWCAFPGISITTPTPDYLLCCVMFPVYNILMSGLNPYFVSIFSFAVLMSVFVVNGLKGSVLLYLPQITTTTITRWHCAALGVWVNCSVKWVVVIVLPAATLQFQMSQCLRSVVLFIFNVVRWWGVVKDNTSNPNIQSSYLSLLSRWIVGFLSESQWRDDGLAASSIHPSLPHQPTIDLWRWVVWKWRRHGSAH